MVADIVLEYFFPLDDDYQSFGSKWSIMSESSSDSRDDSSGEDVSEDELSGEEEDGSGHDSAAQPPVGRGALLPH